MDLLTFCCQEDRIEVSLRNLGDLSLLSDAQGVDVCEAYHPVSQSWAPLATVAILSRNESILASVILEMIQSVSVTVYDSALSSEGP